MKLSKEQIKDIAEYLDMGMVCYIHRETGEVKSMPDFDNLHVDREEWEDLQEEIEDNIDSYVKIKQMSSRESFRIMEAFTEEVSNEKIKNRLSYALNRSKPFRNFKYEVDYDEDVRQQWFKFKASEYEKWVKEHWEDLTNEDSIHEILSGGRYFDDDGNELNPDLYPLPNLCMSCKKRNNPREKVMCNLTRLDQLEDEEFKCFAYENFNE